MVTGPRRCAQDRMGSSRFNLTPAFDLEHPRRRPAEPRRRIDLSWLKSPMPWRSLPGHANRVGSRASQCEAPCADCGTVGCPGWCLVFLIDPIRVSQLRRRRLRLSKPQCFEWTEPFGHSIRADQLGYRDMGAPDLAFVRMGHLAAGSASQFLSHDQYPPACGSRRPAVPGAVPD